jgi:hypothetical protein
MLKDVAAAAPRANGGRKARRSDSPLFGRALLMMEIQRLVPAIWIDTSNCH